MGYHVAEPNSYLVITGAGIETLEIRKKAWVWPMQKVTTISVTPFDFSLQLQAMTIEKLKFSLPAVFTIGPHDDRDALTKYAVLLTGESDGSPAVSTKKAGPVTTGRSHVQEIVKGIIEGETRSIISTMTMEELFNKRTVFKKKVIDNVQSELENFGLMIYNANVKELQDSPGSEYFAFLSRKAHEGALNQAKIDVADARARGEVGEAEKQGKAKQDIARIEANTAVLETERKGEKATADAKLKTKEIGIARDLDLEKISAKRAAESRDVQLQKDVEVKRAEMELERLRASTVTAAKIDRESAAQRAQAELYRKTQEAESQLIARSKEAEAAFNMKKAEADGIRELATAYGELAQVMGGPQGLMQYLMLKDNTYEKLALANAKAINGLQPKINVWTTGQQGEGSDPAAPIRNLFQTLPPLMSTINEQTGITPPNWLMNMPQQQQGATSSERAQSVAKLKANTNGVNGASC